MSNANQRDNAPIAAQSLTVSQQHTCTSVLSGNRYNNDIRSLEGDDTLGLVTRVLAELDSMNHWLLIV